MLPAWARKSAESDVVSDDSGSIKSRRNVLEIALLLALIQNKLIFLLRIPTSNGFLVHHILQLVVWLPSLIVLDLVVFVAIYTLRAYASGTVIISLANALTFVTFATTSINGLFYYATGNTLHMDFLFSSLADPASIWNLIRDSTLPLGANMLFLGGCAFIISRYINTLNILEWKWSRTQSYTLVSSDQDLEGAHKESVEISEACDSKLRAIRRYRNIIIMVLLAIYGVLIALFRPSVPWNQLSRTPTLSLASETLHTLFRTSLHHDQHGDVFTAPRANLRASDAHLTNRIDHVVVIVLESGREDLVPNPEKFVQNVGLKFLPPYQATDVMPFLRGLHENSWVVPNVTTSSDYTTKSFSTIIGGVWPVNQDHTTIEANNVSLPYQIPLPRLFERFATSRGRNSSSGYFSAGRDGFMHYDKVIAKLNFDRYYKYVEFPALY